MGVDFIKKSQPTFERIESAELKTILSGSLFDAAASMRRTFKATLRIVPPPVEEGSFCYVHLEDGHLVIYDLQSQPIAEAMSPPQDVLEAVREEGCGRAVGTVEAVFHLSEQVEIVLGPGS